MHCAFWHGIECEATKPTPTQAKIRAFVSAVLLKSNDLEGSIPPTISNLPLLCTLNLSGNHLEGCIPPELFESLRFLEICDLSKNMLTGPVPALYAEVSRLIIVHACCQRILLLSHFHLTHAKPLYVALLLYADFKI